MGDKTADHIVRLLNTGTLDRKIAAAIVIAELKLKGPEVTKGLCAMLDSGAPALQRPALDALARIGATKAAPHVFALLSSREADVRSDAIEALVACGEEIVPKVRERLSGTTDGKTMAVEERKALDTVLSRFEGSKEAVHTLIAGLESNDAETLRSVAAEVRQRVKNIDAKTRRLWFSEVTKVLERMQKQPPASPVPMATLVKILAMLEDARGIETLLAFARDPKAPFAVRQEAVIGLRYGLSDESQATDVVSALVTTAESDDRLLAQAALMGLVTADLGSKHAERIAKLIGHPDLERARIVIEKLARDKSAESTKALVGAVANQDRRRAELATEALKGRDDAGPSLAAALIGETNADRAHSLRIALRPVVSKLTTVTKKKLVAAALERVGALSAWESHVDIAREADEKSLLEGLRAELAKAQRSKKEDKIKVLVGLLGKASAATDDDRYRLASSRLAASPRDTMPAARRSDESLKLLRELANEGFNVLGAMKKDKTLDLEHLFYVGFHFAEERHALGEEVLEEIVKQAGRTKLGKMAKNKLALAFPE